MDTESFAPGETFDAAFAATRFSNWELADLLDFRDAQHNRHPNERLLFVLDDHHQASYTSSHAQMSSGLTDFDEAMLSAEERATYDETLPANSRASG